VSLESTEIRIFWVHQLSVAEKWSWNSAAQVCLDSQMLQNNLMTKYRLSACSRLTVLALPAPGVRGTLYEALRTHPNIHKHLQTSTNVCELLRKHANNFRSFDNPSDFSNKVQTIFSSYRLRNAVAHVVPYLDMRTSSIHLYIDPVDYCPIGTASL
jgi:hypothetical protein